MKKYKPKKGPKPYGCKYCLCRFDNSDERNAHEDFHTCEIKPSDNPTLKQLKLHFHAKHPYTKLHCKNEGSHQLLKPILLKLLGKSESDLGDYQHAQLRAKIERFLKCSPNEARSRSGKWLDQWVNQKGKKRSFLNKPIVLMEGPQPQNIPTETIYP